MKYYGSHKCILFFGLVLLFGLGITSKSCINPKVQEITLQTMQLSKIRWLDKDEEIDILKKKKNVIAILFSINLPCEQDPSRWVTRCIVTFPYHIPIFVSALDNATRVEGNLREILNEEMQFVFSDNTGIKLGYAYEVRDHYIYGKHWKSKELWKIFEQGISLLPEFSKPKPIFFPGEPVGPMPPKPRPGWRIPLGGPATQVDTENEPSKDDKNSGK